MRIKGSWIHKAEELSDWICERFNMLSIEINLVAVCCTTKNKEYIHLFHACFFNADVSKVCLLGRVGSEKL